MRKALAGAVALAVSVVVAAPAAAAVTPTSMTLTIPAGASATTPASVGVALPRPKVDVELAIDTTESMRAVDPDLQQAPIAEIKAQAADIVAAVRGVAPDSQFAVVDFKDVADGPNEYLLRQPMTASASDLTAAVQAMIATGGGGSLPEAYNLIFHNAYADPATGWRPDARKFVVVIGDAGPHLADGQADLYPDCFTPADADADDGFVTADELANLAAAQRSLIMLASPASGFELCYSQLIAGAFGGSAALELGPSIPDQLATQIGAAVATIGQVDMTVARAPAGADASWISFTPASTGPVTAPADVPFTVHAAVPAGTPDGSYVFDLEGRADGGDVGHLKLTVVVPAAPTTGGDGDAGDGTVTIAKTVDRPMARRGGVVTYTITIHNGSTGAVKVRRVVDLLPRKFRFVSGSSEGAGRPKVRYGHRQITWWPWVSVAAGDDLVITFSARVRLHHGCGSNRAWAKLVDGSVLRTGPTAPVCVKDDDEDDHGDDGGRHGGGDDHGGDHHGGGDRHGGGDDQAHGDDDATSGGHGHHG